MCPWKRTLGVVVLYVLAEGGSASAASTISTTTSAFDSASRIHVHFAKDHYWVAFHDGATPVLFSSRDGVSWASQGSIFTFNPAPGGMWTTRFSGSTIIALGFNSGDSTRYYRSGTLHSSGVVAWSGETVVEGAATATPVNGAIAGGKPVYWRASAAGAGQLGRGSAIASPTWSNAPIAPNLAPTTGGRFWAGALFPAGGSNPEDLVVLRATTGAAYSAGNHRLVSLRYDQSADLHDPSWYDVSTLGSTLAESAVTEVKEAADDAAQLRFAAARDTSGQLHAVYVNRVDDVVHYRKDAGFAGIWSRIATDVTQTASAVDRVGLTAAAANNLFLFYSKSDNGIYYRRFDGTSWGGESVLKAADANPLQGALAAMESFNGCSLGLAWAEGSGPSYDVMFSAGAGSCHDLAVSAGAGTLTVTAPASFEMRFNTSTGGGVDEFFDLAEDPGRVHDLAGGVAEILAWHDLGTFRVGTTFFSTTVNDAGARIELLEATPTRVRVRHEAFYQAATATTIHPGIKAWGDYTISGTGKSAHRFTRAATSAVNFDRQGSGVIAHLAGAPLDTWAAYSQTDGTLPNPGTDHFVLFQNEQPGARTDFLEIIARDWTMANGYLRNASATATGPSAPGEWRYVAWSDTSSGTIPADSIESWDFLTYFKPTTFANHADPAVAARSADYRSPDPLSAIGPGSGWNENPTDGDFFNESEAAYTLNLNPATGLSFSMDGSTTTRHSPFFKIRRWRSLTPPSTIIVGGATKVRDIDFKADVKPISRSAFAQELLWYSTLQTASAVDSSPGVGSPGVSLGVSYVAARYGQGARVTANSQFIAVPVTDGTGAFTGNFDGAKGALEFWYQPSWSHDDGVRHDIGGVFVDVDNQFVISKLATNALRFRIRMNAIDYDCTVSSANYSFRASEWVHLRFEWDESPAAGPEQRILINQSVPAQTCAADFTADAIPAPNAYFLLGDIGDGAATFGAGVYDEVHFFGTSSTTPTALADGGLASSTNEYLGAGDRNFPLAFVTRDADSRGRYLFVGSDSQFLGLNVALAVEGASADANLRIDYWNGTGWALLSDTDTGSWAPGFSDTSDSLRRDGALSWPESLVPGWSPYSVKGGPDLYYVRIGQQSGTYTTPPTEAVIRTDILLFQYCEDVTAAAQTFVFGEPVPTAVELASFEAQGLNGAVELSWTTASELRNLGFHLHRSSSLEGPYARITASPIPGLGSSPSGASYRYIDSGLLNGSPYYYKLEDVETTGKTGFHGPVSATPWAGAPEARGPSSLVYGDPSATSFRVLSQDGSEILLELETGGFRAEPRGDGSVRLEIPGFTEYSEAGSPLLPVARRWIGMAGAREVEVISVRAEQVETFPHLRPAAAEAPEIVATARGTVRAGSRFRAEGATFRGEGLYPEEAARILEVGFQGDHKKALVELSPLRWDRSTGTLVLARRLEVRIALSGREPRARRRKEAPAPRDVALRLRTRERGLHAVRYEEVFDARRHRGGTSIPVRLSRLGEAVPMHIEPPGVGFGPGATLFFMSEGASSNPYGDEAVYELERGEVGIRMSVVPGSPSGPSVSFYWHQLSREEDRYYQAGLVESEDPWLWDLLLAPESKSYSFAVSELAATGEPSRLSVRLQGTSDLPVWPDHHLRLAVNGTPVLESSFEGKSSVRLTAEIPAGVLREGANELTIENQGNPAAAYSSVMLDGFEVYYPRRLVAGSGFLEGTFAESGVAEVAGLEDGAFALEVGPEIRWLGTSSRFPVEAGRRYMVVSSRSVRRPRLEPVSRSGLRSSGNRADYLVLGPRDFFPQARPLLEHRERQGLRTRFVAVEDVYSELGFGEPRPEAIKEFLAYAYHHWQEPAPRYVLLLGDATYDFKDRLGTGVQNRVPPLMVRTSYLWTVSDPSYAAVHGDDELPDLAIGRLPAASADEARVMVEKILAYEASGPTSPGPVAIVADDPDGAGDFEADAEELANGVLGPLDPRRIYLRRLGTAATRAAVAQTFDEGPSLLSYLGHGGIHLWASENVLDTARIPSLAPATRQPFVITLNCLNGYFHFPYFDSLGEALVKAEGKGAIAAFSPSGLSLNEPAHLFHEKLLEELLSRRHLRLGDAVLAAQGTYADSGAFPELLRIYHLLGDPALLLP